MPRDAQRGTRPPRSLQAPRLATDLAPLVGPTLDDDADWNEVDVSGRLSGAREVAGVDINGARLRGVNLSGWVIDRLRLSDVVFEDCDLAGTILDRAAFTRVEFRGCRMSGLAAGGLVAEDVRLTACKLDGASFRMSRWERVTMEDCDLTNADFYEAALRSARLLDSGLAGADFSRASMAGTALHGSRLAGIQGGDGLRGVVIGSDQMVALSLAAFAALDILVDDDPGAR